LKTLLQAQIAPGRDDEFLRLLTEADIRLLEFARYSWCKGRVTLTPDTGLVVLPAGYASILGAQVNGYAKDIRAEEFEFTPDGVGDVEVNGCEDVRLIDQGLNDDGLRYYKISGVLPEDTTVKALCHFAPLPLYDSANSSPGDPGSPDVAALKLAMLAIIYEESNDMTTSGQYMATALRGLDAKEKAHRGGAKQMLNIRPNGPGIRKIGSFR
jgi:hypothetical protein